ncbi:TetR/AcrR family transcriptional regulator C-terminal domain-containing protein [Amycolatopsis sp. CA-230715]|uniref:TetR/AcrR family transcriptional regulator C-terminal domain-containing protein n=1 Tax=Amycolatopsis sp. CA-230715 TaxID=2745196 RepID=UPI001C035A16|nr:TetR/AcrR family transcriptional regulator C-terminal domain-containing protein [Amycolatopsis sp. CA-230715]QWF79880.1 Tetracycline repressor protein class G [Amycolatopsis sp. CA-230715]
MALNKAVVLAAAVALLDEVGLDALSTRKLATRLDVQVGALYWHYPSKQALLDAIAEQICEDMTNRVLAETGWTEQFRAIAVAHREAMLAHTDGARVIATMSKPGPHALAFIERPKALVRGLRIPEHEVAAIVDTLTSYVNGYAIEEQARQLHKFSRAQRDHAFLFGIGLLVKGILAQYND